MTPVRRRVGLAVLVALAAGAILARLVIDRDPSGVIRLAWPEPEWSAFRWTAILAGTIVGGALGLAGLMLQVLLRNALASPAVLGVSSGAGLGVVLSWHLAGGMVWFGDDLAAVAGGLLVLGIVFALGQRRGLVDPVAIILVGVVVSMICGALMMLVQHLSPAGMRADLITWMMGEIPQLVDRSTLVAAAVVTGLAAIVAVGAGRAMDVAVLDDDEARTVGLSLGRLRLFLFLASGLLTAGAVAVAGPIGFVGLVGPHAARLLVGPRHRLLVVGSVLAGIALVVGADAARQTIDLGRGRLPIGVLTALVGGPLFIWLLRRGGRSG